MDHWGVITQAWSLTRRSRPLLGLGAISAAQTFVYAPIVMLMVGPLVALPRLVSALATMQRAQESGASDTLNPAVANQIAVGSQWLLDHFPAIVGTLLALVGLWTVLAILDVAAQAGMVHEASSGLDGSKGSVSDGLRTGFRNWWRTAYLLAIAALPGLVMLTVIAAAGLFAYTIPLMHGQAPNAITGASMQLLFGPLQTAASLLGVVLGVIAQVSLRFAVVDDLKWRAAWSRGWALTRSHVADVLVVYVLVAVVGGVATLVVVAVSSTVAGGFVALGFAAAAVGHTTAGGIAVGTFGGLVAIAAYVAFLAVLLAWTSAVWTVLWRRLAHRDPQAPGSAVGAGASADVIS